MLTRNPMDGVFLLRLRRQDEDGDYEHIEVIVTCFDKKDVGEELSPEILHGGWEISFAAELTPTGDEEF